MHTTSYTAIQRNVSHIVKALGDEVNRNRDIELNVYCVDASDNDELVFFVLEGDKKEIKEFTYIANKRVNRFVDDLEKLEKLITH